jgi:hypothetical protein
MLVRFEHDASARAIELKRALDTSMLHTSNRESPFNATSAFGALKTRKPPAQAPHLVALLSLTLLPESTFSRNAPPPSPK